MNQLTAYRVHLDNGTDYVTSMAATVTPEQARAYFVGQEFEQRDGSTAKCVAVDTIRPPASMKEGA